MNILITGGAGFIGSYLAEKLLSCGHNLLVVDNFETGSVRNLAAVIDNPDFKLVEGDVSDFDTFSSLDFNPDVVFHLAASVGVKKIMREPVKSINTNIYGTENVLKYALNFGAKVIIASSSEVYGKSNAVSFREDSSLIIGNTPVLRWSYAASKAVDEFLAFSYRREFSLPIVVARFFNVCGPRQTGAYGMVIPTFVEQAMGGLPITVYGGGEQIRSFTYVKDAVEMLVRIAVTEKCEGEIFNIGALNVTSINGLALSVKLKANSNSVIKHISYAEAYGDGFEDMPLRIPDISKVVSYTGYEPVYSLDDILDSVMEYLRTGERKALEESVN